MPSPMCLEVHRLTAFYRTSNGMLIVARAGVKLWRYSILRLGLRLLNLDYLDVEM